MGIHVVSKVVRAPSKCMLPLKLIEPLEDVFNLRRKNEAMTKRDEVNTKSKASLFKYIRYVYLKPVYRPKENFVLRSLK